MSRRRIVLSSSETGKVIKVWRTFITALRANKRNNVVIERMCQELSDVHDLQLTPAEFRTRINNLTKKFRFEKRKMRPSDWEHFNEINSFIGQYKSNSVEEHMIEGIDPLSDEVYDDPIIKDYKAEDAILELPNSSSSGTSISSLDSQVIPSTTATRPASQSLKRRCPDSQEKFLELAKNEAERFKSFCEKALENDAKRLKLLEESNKIQQRILDTIQRYHTIKSEPN